MMVMFPAISLSTNITVKTNITVSATPTPRTTTTQKLHKTTPPLGSTLKSLCKLGKLEEALSVIESSKRKPNDEDIEVFSLFLHACISTKSLEHAQKLRSHILRSKPSLLQNPTLKSKLITLFSVCGQLDEARRVFNDQTSGEATPSEPVWVAMAIGYSRNGFSTEVLLLYSNMLLHSVKPGNFAFSAALKACVDTSDAFLGRAIHAQIVKHDEEADQVVNNALLKFYVECGGCFNEALKVFEVMPQRNVVSWNTLIAGFAGQGRVFEMLDAFRVMQGEAMGFSWVTLTTVLPVCGQVTALHSGKEIHGQIVKSKKRGDVPLLNSLMDMYAKCGAIGYCRKVFDRMQNKDLTSWNTMLSGYSINGQIDEAMALFDEMISNNVRPDGITFVALLSGCSHSGLTSEGNRLFHVMQNYGVKPSLEHYACLVDMLGRSGKIHEGLAVAESLPMKPSGSIWGSLLNSCRLYGNVSLAETVAERLFEIEPNNSGNYVMLSNIYANAGMWEEVKRVREMMAMRGIKKDAGCSWIQIKHRIHTFVAGGSTDFRNSAEFCRVWSELSNATKKVGYVPDTEVVLHDINEEMKTMWVCGHSERLAAVYALINTGEGMPVRITKNLRVCVDCHSWMKAVSRVTRRLIVLRDTNRFHHFENGTCSCKDYW
ncbi:pentatricopeptide repeat-containing protein At3g14330 [Arachis duranensis]|uniref:Pentatricopeptide repeat-containing protein At3g14330 n=1 Tax=Arachis duranensis TaxID=130453 RepID=A0A6P4DLC0_ARADU|nr:pentatricopeptide repeat-containing protein At3g14330 [Arachis duranensis]